MTYQVLDWDKNFENNKSRERDRCGFVCVPNKQDGLGLTHILTESDGAAIYGIFQLIIGALSRQRKPRAGWLTVDGHQTGTPWALHDLALRWRRPVAEIGRALEVLCSERVGWMGTNCPPSARAVPAECPGIEEKGIEEKGKEKNTAGKPAECEPAGFTDLWDSYPRKVGREACLRKVKALLKGTVKIESLTAAARNYALACAGKEPRYVKHGATFYGPDKWWEDYVNGQPQSERVGQNRGLVGRSFASAGSADKFEGR